jgi:ribonuclease HI
MPAFWIAARFRSDDVLVRCDPSGKPEADEGGFVDFAYKPGGRSYRSRLDRFAFPDGGQVIEASDGGRAPSPAKGGAKSSAPPKPSGMPQDPSVLQLWTDGACSGNPGPAGAGALIREGGEIVHEISEYLGEGTNNIAELMAILLVLQAVGDGSRAIDLMTDSSYCIGVLSKGWKAKANQELIAELRGEVSRFSDLRFVKVPGHAGVPDNERVDELAREAILARA